MRDISISEFDDDPDHWPAIKDNNYLNFRGTHAVQTSTKSPGKNYHNLIQKLESSIIAQTYCHLPTQK